MDEAAAGASAAAGGPGRGAAGESAAVAAPRFGSSLPAVLRRRFGVPPLVTLVVVGACALAGAVAIVLALSTPPSPGTQVTHAQPPVFNVLYPPGLMHRAHARPGELMRIEGHRGKLTIEIVVRPLRLPHYSGDVTHGLLPVYADRFADAQAKILPGFVLTSEGRARVNNGVGYEIGFQSVRPQQRVYGLDVLLVPDDMTEGKGLVTLSLRQTKPGGAFTKPERPLAYQSKKAYRSFRFGTGRG
jgi:hypothetical protein